MNGLMNDEAEIFLLKTDSLSIVNKTKRCSHAFQILLTTCVNQ